MDSFVLTKKYLYVTIFVVLLVLLSAFLPYFALAVGGLVPCDETSNSGKGCQFSDLVTLFQKVMDFLLWTVMVPLATIAIAFVGVQYMTAVGNPTKLAKAHEVLWDVLLGIFIALAAWLIINTIFTVLTGSGLPSITG